MMLIERDAIGFPGSATPGASLLHGAAGRTATTVRFTCLQAALGERVGVLAMA
jgi:hypothetical protein